MKRQAKSLVSLCLCAGWSELLLVAHTTLMEISCHGSCHAGLRDHGSDPDLNLTNHLLYSVLEANNLFIWVVSTLNMWPCHKFTLNYRLLILPGLYFGLNETLIELLRLCNTHGNTSLRISEQSASWAKFTTLLKG